MAVSRVEVLLKLRKVVYPVVTTFDFCIDWLAQFAQEFLILASKSYSK